MGPTTELRRELKASFIPLVTERGFVMDLRGQPRSVVFRRSEGSVVHMFALQWEKYGKPRFALHFGTCPVKGLSFQGKVSEPTDVYPSWCMDAGTLQPRKGTGSRSWFRQDSLLLERLFLKPASRRPAEVVAELLGLFPEVERYWSTGEVGPHMRIWDPNNSRGVQNAV